MELLTLKQRAILRDYLDSYQEQVSEPCSDVEVSKIKTWLLSQQIEIIKAALTENHLF